MKLRVWWIPQVPGTPFYVDVDSVEEGVKIMNVLAAYDQFQFDNNIKPDYADVGGIEMLEEGEWCSWCDYELEIDDPIEYLKTKGKLD
jgi:hypothetical protein